MQRPVHLVCDQRPSAVDLPVDLTADHVRAEGDHGPQDDVEEADEHHEAATSKRTRSLAIDAVLRYGTLPAAGAEVRDCCEAFTRPEFVPDLSHAQFGVPEIKRKIGGGGGNRTRLQEA